MIIIDTELERRQAAGRPIRVGVIGAGYIARAYVRQILTAVRGMTVAAISNRTVETARRVFEFAGVDGITGVDSARGLEDAVARGRYAITDNPFLLCEAGNIDVIVEATGEVEFGAKVVAAAIQNGKHVVLSNAELDATLGPIFKVRADRTGVVYTNIDGDEPGVAMNIYRFIRSIGLKPVVAGNFKGFLDRHRNPDTQKGFAEKTGQKPHMVASFADGTKLSMETTVLANATGMKAAKRGMYGPQCAHVSESLKVFPLEELLHRPVVDYLLGAEPGTGAFVIGYSEDAVLRNSLGIFKMGNGPFYVFYTPYHLPQVQLPHTVARAALFQDPTVTPMGAPMCEVIAVAKRDLKAGETLDGIGEFMTYGVIDSAEITQRESLLPMGLARGCRLKTDIPADREISYADVIVPEGRFCDALLAEQDEQFGITRPALAGAANAANV
jgi:predicted homoserine dehydrogenase-like protein